MAAKHGMLTLLFVTRSHTHDIHFTGLVTASAATVLAGPFSKSGYLTLVV